MILAEIVEGKKEALRVTEVARILDVSIKKIYRMAAMGQIPYSQDFQFDQIRSPRSRHVAEKPIEYKSHTGNLVTEPLLFEQAQY